MLNIYLRWLLQRFNYCLPDFVSGSTNNHYHIGTQLYDSHCMSITSWFDLTGNHWLIVEPTLLNTFKIRNTIFACLFEEEGFDGCWWAQQTVFCPWKFYGTDSVWEDWGLDIDNWVFQQYWNTYLYPHCGLLVIRKNLAIANDWIVQKPIWQNIMQQQQLSLSEFLQLW
jgi:hypothetical protein